MVKIQMATSVFAMASARKICGMDQCAFSRSARQISEAATTKPEFWMFSAPITRLSSVFGVRLWISANSGTTKKPVNRPMPTRSTAIRQLPGCAMKPAMSRFAAVAMPWRAKYRSNRNALMPNAPSGTRPISTVRAESFSHSIEPMPVPMENSASTNTYSVLPPPRLSGA